MHSSAKPFEATQTSFSQPTALSHLDSIHRALREYVFDGCWYQGHHCLIIPHDVIAAVDTIPTLWRSRGIFDEGHRQLPVGSQNAIMISVTFDTGNSFLYYIWSFRYRLTTHCILCQVQAICHFRFVHRRLRPKTVQLTCSVFPAYLINWHVGKNFHENRV